MAQKFTFLSNGGTIVTVEAQTEKEARREAMKKIWGGDWFVIGKFTAPYIGYGLMLQKVE